MEITVQQRISRGHCTYKPLCENAKILAEVAGRKYISVMMMKRAKKMGVKILSKEGGKEIKSDFLD